MKDKKIYEKYIKRILDFILSLLALIILAPLMIILFIIIRINLGKPVIFKQKRPGKNGKIFVLYKFRTMTNEKDKNGSLLSDAQRFTKLGRILRKTSFDELPELVNILKGDMSIIGPRPQLIRDMLFMTDEQKKRHSVRPGLTGLAQINGRNAISWDRKLELDLIYIKKISFLFDANIVLKTIITVFKKDGITQEGMETADDLCDYLLKENRITQEEYIKKRNLEKNFL
jgi:undecaprenyl phosphate N,N'-diacetylbacillosamine 1-phosphate transferase